MSEPSRPGASGASGVLVATRGVGLRRLSWSVTALFTVLAVAAVLLDPLVPVFVVVSLLMFAIGCVVFVLAFLRAVDRSRTETIGIGGLFFGAGTAPGRVQAVLMGSLAVEVVVAVTVAVLRPYTALAFGTLAPMYGLGLAGLWVALFGVFPGRAPELTRAGRRDADRAAHQRGGQADLRPSPGATPARPTPPAGTSDDGGARAAGPEETSE